MRSNDEQYHRRNQDSHPDNPNRMRASMMFTLHCGDCREVMTNMLESSIDAIVTDPPYGLEFMGAGWDQKVPGAEFWKEALRVAKPGAHLLAFGGTRTFHRLICAIEDAGWQIRDCLMWVYGSGFPKSLDVSKTIDKADGVEKKKELDIALYLKQRRTELELSKAFVDDYVFGGTTRYAFVEGRDDPTGAGRIYLPTPAEWKKLKEVLKLDDRFDDYIQRAIPEREMRSRADGGKSKLVKVNEGDWGYQKTGEMEQASTNYRFFY